MALPKHDRHFADQHTQHTQRIYLPACTLPLLTAHPAAAPLLLPPAASRLHCQGRALRPEPQAGA